MTSKPKRIALFGGGRWAHTLFNVLSGLLGNEDTVLWQTRHGFDAVRARLDDMPAHGGAAAQLVATREGVWQHHPTAVVVATAPGTHAKIALEALAQRLPVLVEKPIALSLEDADALIATGKEMNTPIGVNLEYLYASYLRELARHTPVETVASIALIWVDPLIENRQGETKRADLATHRCLDIFPHLWSILRLLTKATDVSVHDAVPSDTYPDALELSGSSGAVPFSAQISRRGTGRIRAIEITTTSDKNVRLDFSDEPGKLFIDGQIAPFDCGWEQEPRPLAGALSGFLAVAENLSERPDWLLDVQRCRPHLVGALASVDKAQTAEAAWIAARAPLVLSEPAVRLVDNLIPEFAHRGHFEIARAYAADPARAEALAAAATAALTDPAPDTELGRLLNESPFMARINSARP